MMLNVCGDRKVYQNRQSRDPRLCHCIAHGKLPIHGNSDMSEILMFKHSCNDVECLRDRKVYQDRHSRDP
jgi:hypothetical protein